MSNMEEVKYSCFFLCACGIISIHFSVSKGEGDLSLFL